MFSINLSSRFLNSSGCRFFICIVSMRTRLYSSGSRQKFCHTTGSDFNSFITSSSITKPLSVISGKTALPASVISPSLSILRHLSLFSSDQLLRGFLGHSLCAVTPSASFFVVLSIHPKHIASSTASIYQNVPSSTGLPRFTTTQHSGSLSWFRISHSRSSSRDLTFSKLFIVIYYLCSNTHTDNSFSTQLFIENACRKFIKFSVIQKKLLPTINNNFNPLEFEGIKKHISINRPKALYFIKSGIA